MHSRFLDALPLELLGPALQSARAAIRGLDEDDVPARLRKVASYSGGRLPVPLARALIKFLDGEEWLRDRAAKELSGADADSDGPDGVSALFLLRPEGWELDIGRRVERFTHAETADRLGALDGLVAEANEREAEAKRRLQQVKEHTEERERTHREELEAVRAQLREVRESDRRDEAEHTREVAALKAALLETESSLQREIEAGQALKQRLRRAEEQRAEVERRIQAGAQTAWGAGDPVALARHLDMLIRTVEADPALLELTNPPLEREWKLPPGARPDERNAVEWLMRQARAFTCIVDGYNLTHRLSGGTDSAARERLNEELSRFKLRAMTPVKVMVVYDSAVNPHVATESGPGGVRVRFTKEGLSADEEIRRLAAEIEEPVVVVSSDREVREGSEQHGAIALWAEALTDWVRAR